MNIPREAMRISSSIIRNVAHDLTLVHDINIAINDLLKASDTLWEAANMSKSKTPSNTVGGECND